MLVSGVIQTFMAEFAHSQALVPVACYQPGMSNRSGPTDISA